jgi:hypothetical protein
MSSSSQLLESPFLYEPLLIDLFKDEINEQHAKILALMFELGGYTTLNIVTDRLCIAQPTISVRVEELVKKKLLRKNTELMPMALVLLLDNEKLSFLINRRIKTQRNAVEFLNKASTFKNLHSIKDTFIQAIHVLYPNQQVLANMISSVYLHQIILKDELFRMIHPDKNLGRNIIHEYDSILSSSQDVLNVGKYRKSEIFVQPRLPLELFVKNRLIYLETLTDYYNNLLVSLRELSSREYVSIIPHQQLNYPSEVKKKIDICLKNYATVRVIDNGIYQKESGKTILELLVNNEHFGFTNKKGIRKEKHQLYIITHNERGQPKSQKISQVYRQISPKDLNHDYRTRDFIIFGNHGCIVFSSVPNIVPYYNISPRFITQLLHTFKSIWK